MSTPIPIILHCPECGEQHIDAAEEPCDGFQTVTKGNDEVGFVTLSVPCQLVKGHKGRHSEFSYHPLWTNPPHKSHLCHACGTIWRPADVETVGVSHVQTLGEKDNWFPDIKQSSKS